MAWPKVFNQMIERLDSIEAKLDKLVPTSADSKSKSSPGSELLKGSLLADFDDYTVADALRKIKNLSEKEKREILDHEKSHKNRSLIIEALAKE